MTLSQSQCLSKVQHTVGIHGVPVVGEISRPLTLEVL